MATYTLELFRVLELRDNKIGLDDYPIFDEKHRETLNNLIISTYLTREIGQESIDYFVVRMRAKMHQIMPYYNALFESELLKYDPLINISMRSTNKREAESTETSEGMATSEGTNASNAEALNSVLPQVGIDDDGNYATDLTKSNGSTAANSKNEQSATSGNKAEESFTSEQTGYQGSPNALLAEYRANLLNIDLEIVMQLSDLFMLVWELPVNLLPDSFTRLPNL